MSLQDIFTAYLYIMLGGALFFALYESWRGFVHGWTVTEKKLCQCPDCHRAFLTIGTRSSARCPRCNNLCRIQDKVKKKRYYSGN